MNSEYLEIVQLVNLAQRNVEAAQINVDSAAALMQSLINRFEDLVRGRAVPVATTRTPAATAELEDDSTIKRLGRPLGTKNKKRLKRAPHLGPHFREYLQTHPGEQIRVTDLYKWIRGRGLKQTREQVGMAIASYATRTTGQVERIETGLYRSLLGGKD